MARMHLTVIALVVAALAVATAGKEVMELDASSFHRVVDDPSKNVVVKFYAPWCGHCQHLKPTWKQLAEQNTRDDVIVAHIDVDKHREIASEYGIQGFPTIKIFPKLNKKGIEHEGGRDIDEMTAFIAENAQ